MEELFFGAVYGVSGSGIVDAAVSDNQVFINNGTIRGDIFGGFAHNMLGATLARGNRIIVNGGELEKFSFGGFAQTSDRPCHGQQQPDYCQRRQAGSGGERRVRPER